MGAANPSDALIQDHLGIQRPTQVIKVRPMNKLHNWCQMGLVGSL